MRMIDADIMKEKLEDAINEFASKEHKEIVGLDIIIDHIVKIDEIRTLKEWIDSQPTVEPNRWIPCSERLPDDTTYENHLVVVYRTKSGTVDVGWYEAFFKKWWRLEPDEEVREEVIAWMPLPEPARLEE